MNVSRALCFALVSLNLGACLRAQAPAGETLPRVGWVHGTVLDDNDHPAGGGEVDLYSRENEFTAAVDPNGKFMLRVPADVYSIRVTRPDSFVFQRAVVFVAPFSDVYLNVRPVYHAALGGPEKESQIHYFSFTGPGRMQYGAVLRSVEGQDTQMLTYDSMAVYARIINCDRRSFMCIAEGSPSVEFGTTSGVRQERAARIEIDMAKRKVLLYSEDAVDQIEF